MSADDATQRPARRITRHRLRRLAVVVAVMALLTAGWPLVNAMVADRQPLAGGSKLIIGSGTRNSAVVTVGRGWSVLPEESNPVQGYLLRRGPVELSILHVDLVNSSQVARLWSGVRRILLVSSPSARLGAPVFFRTARGLPGLSGAITTARKVGTATIVPGPSRQFAIVMLVLAPRGTHLVMRVAGARVVGSLRFTTVHQ